jgi:uncharacterized repeat protein (TIGR03803 family)
MIRDLLLRPLHDSQLAIRALGTTLLVLGLMALAGCNDQSSSVVPAGNSPAVSKIELTATDSRVAKGTSTQLTATTVYRENRHADVGTDVTWLSSNTAVATVSSNGKVSTVGPGTATITATCKVSSVCGSISANITVTVTAATLVSIALTPPTLGVAVGTSQQFTATGTYSDSSTQVLTTTVTWASSNTSVATIGNASGSQGLATGLQAGSTSITAALSGVTSPAVTLTVTALTESVMHSFGGTGDGQLAFAGLIQGTDGNLYGTSTIGGAYGEGTVFKITPAGAQTVLWSFGNGSDGQEPYAGLIQGTDGNFYGTTYLGGAHSAGTVFKITPTGVETVLYSFGTGSDGQNPEAALVQGTDGNFYGTSTIGGAYGEGTVFKITAAGAETVLWSFGNGSDGKNPEAGLVQGTDGNFYGTTFAGGAYGEGTVFKITAAGAETVLWSFGNGNDGQEPYAGLIQGTDGNFYGTTVQGGASSDGTTFKITPAGVETVLWSFGGGNDGQEPYAGLIQGTDGNFYGTTVQGGANSYGTIFKITPAGVETVLYSFEPGSDAEFPTAALIQGTDGHFYGTTYEGGANGDGTVFKY